MTDPLPLPLGVVNDLLATGGRWAHGELLAATAERIGVGFGLSGTSYRIAATTDRSERVSLVLKLEAADKIRTAREFRRGNEAALGRSIPRQYGSLLGLRGGRGVLAMEDVHPATQGDELAPCPPPAAERVIGILAGLHARTWVQDGGEILASWLSPAWDPKRWSDRLARAANRYPGTFTPDLRRRLHAFDVEAHVAGRDLAHGPAAWIHGDPHLDNVLWRPDGTPVLIDWATATLGPPAVDLAVLLLSFSFGATPVLPPAGLIGVYVGGLRNRGLELSEAEVTMQVRRALTRQIQGVVGFIGMPDEPTDRRALALRDDAPHRVRRGLAWLAT